MIYLESFTLPDINAETGYKLSYNSAASSMTCFGNNTYPFDMFPFRKIQKLEMSDITVFYGKNGSGKSTLLNVMGNKLGLVSTQLFNDAPCFEDYVDLCRYRTVDDNPLPSGSALLRSDDVFDYMIGLRSINAGVSRQRDELFEEYQAKRDEDGFLLSSLDDYEELKLRNLAKRSTKSKYLRTRGFSQSIRTSSNGETAHMYFINGIKENALYLLDEPENSLSVKLQIALAQFIEESVRFYGCQFIISSHSPFILSLSGAKVYDLDAEGDDKVKNWTELENVRLYYDFFKQRDKEFK